MSNRLDQGVVNNVSNCILSTSDTSGAGAHADFISGWPQDMMESIIANCTNGGPKDDAVHCVLEDFELNGRERKKVELQGRVPMENVDQVEELPTGWGEKYILSHCWAWYLVFLRWHDTTKLGTLIILIVEKGRKRKGWCWNIPAVHRLRFQLQMLMHPICFQVQLYKNDVN